MWIITVHSNQNLNMYEFNSEQEARIAYGKIKGVKILTQIVYYNDSFDQ